jgi:hypothetical protein
VDRAESYLLAQPYFGLVRRVVELYTASPDLDEEAAAQVLAAEGVPDVEATFAACIVPSAFGRVLAQELGVECSTEFLVASHSGELIAYVYGEQPISRTAMLVAVTTFVHGPRDQFKACASRSAEVNAINEALYRHDTVAGWHLQPTTVWGVFAEDLGDVGRRE